MFLVVYDKIPILMGKENILAHFQDWKYLAGLKEKHFRHLSCHEIRMASWERSKQEFEEAERTNQPVSLVEWIMGMRKECLEWEVRDTVLGLQENGYTTYYSGYQGNDGKHVLRFVSIEPPPESLLKKIWQITDETGILTWESGGGQISDCSLRQKFNPGGKLYTWGIFFIYSGGNPNEIKRHWDKIAQTMPDLGWQQLTDHTPYAEEFRRNHTLEEVVPQS